MGQSCLAGVTQHPAPGTQVQEGQVRARRGVDVLESDSAKAWQSPIPGGSGRQLPLGPSSVPAPRGAWGLLSGGSASRAMTVITF